MTGSTGSTTTTLTTRIILIDPPYSEPNPGPTPRFVGLHRAALGFPAAQFEYEGLQPSRGSRFSLAAATKGEQENAVKV